jgi:BirA family transcriptional regulator, biotin operon repressor / biotin---[acetyl-CoA-carboxylase] ligase
MNHPFDPALVTERLHGQRVRGPVVYHDVTGSTNDDVMALAEAGGAEGTVVVAGTQTAGRGRRGRLWHAPEAQTLMFSLLLRPPVPVQKWPLLSTMTSVAIVSALPGAQDSRIGTKWPNDIVHDGRKLGGILVEARAPRFAVIGIGLNVSGDTSDWPDDLQRTATTLEAATGTTIGREELLARVLNGLDECYALMLTGNAALTERQRELESTLGKELVMKVGQRQVRGKAVDLTALGELVLETTDGPLTISSGEVQQVRAANGELPR